MKIMFSYILIFFVLVIVGALVDKFIFHQTPNQEKNMILSGFIILIAINTQKHENQRGD